MTGQSTRSGGGVSSPIGRTSLALLVAAAGAIHLYLWFDYFHRVHVVGVLFLANAAAGIVVGAAVLLKDDIVVLSSAAGFALGTLAAFVVSTRSGLFGYRERFWGSWQEGAGGVELTALVLALALLASRAAFERGTPALFDSPRFPERERNEPRDGEDGDDEVTDVSDVEVLE